MNRADVVIVGGGFAGLCAAAALADGRRKVVVLEARTGPDPRFRGELIHPPGVEILRRLGLYEPLVRAGGAPCHGFAVMLEADREPAPLSYTEVRGGSPLGLAISHQDMVACLRDEISRRPGIEIHTGVRVAELLRSGIAVEGVKTAAGVEIRAPLTIVAEGRHSKLRRALGFAEETQLLSFTAALVCDGGPLPRPNYGHVFLGTWGPILAYEIGTGKVRMCIDLPVKAGKGQEAVDAFLRAEAAPSVPEPLRSAMLRSLREEGPEVCANHSITTHRCTLPGVALIGDSGGCSHPLTATGMTIALHDIEVLADELSKGASVNAALASYQRRRYGFVRAREILAQGLYDVFRRGDVGARAIRSGLLRYWTSGPRARAASLALLSGHESRLRAFIAEYLAVVASSGLDAAVGGDPSGVEGRREALGGLGQMAYDQLERTVQMMYRDFMRRTAPQPVAAISEALVSGTRRVGAVAGASVSRRERVDPASAEPRPRVTTERTPGLL